MKEEPKKYKPEDIIRLNVGGQRFDTFLGTLLADRTSDIYSQFVVLLEPESSSEPHLPKDIDGAMKKAKRPDAKRMDGKCP
ncbi:hypothetical protein Y032_0013g2149 [Ancylostoma ceylanicum]|uniref:Potassium channel tetramerisation-type BTB domain-containing protein n=1 Tax=Ancylostoma ceylanicum TaxID=53326 RepID=A0A016VC72_9BILA|nr:hypothetical protein Y032_0013g2149 [Ancylostoma ceylanicum]